MGFLNQTMFIVQGMRSFTSGGYERNSRAFDNSVLERDLRGRVCLVTGANQGLGYETAKELAKRGCTLFMACRSEERGREAVEKVQAESDNKDVHLKLCDISSMESVKALAADLEGKQTRLHVLVNNAGVMKQSREESADGHEVNFATNTLGVFALTKLLSPSLERAGPGSRIITVTSGGAYTAPLVTDDLGMEKEKYDGTTQYARDKRRQMALMERFGEKLLPAGVGCFLMHPGWTDTAGVQNSIPGFHKTFEKQLRSLQQGADTIVWLALADQNSLEQGALYLDRQVQHKHLFMGGTRYSSEAVDGLWTKLAAMAGVEP